MLTEITAPPRHISVEDHAQLTASTPSNFADIPPVLRWGNDAEVEVGGEGWWEGRLSGRLWVTEDEVAFIPSSGEKGFSLVYQSLTLHALTSASSAGPAHLYCQVDDRPALPDSETEEDDGEDMEMREIRIFVIEDQLQALYDALSACSALHAPLLPNGQTSSFPFFDNDDDDGNGEDNDAWEDADEDGETGVNGGDHEDDGHGAGRIRSDFHSGGGPEARFRPY